MSEYAGRQFVGIDLHRRRSVIVRTDAAGEVLETVRILNDVDRLNAVLSRAGECPEVVLEATYGWYWAVDALQRAGARVHLAHPLGVKAFEYRRVKNDVRDATDLADLLRMGRLPEAWIAPPATRELRELVRHRAKLVGLRSQCKAEVHAVLAKCGIPVVLSDLFGPAGTEVLDQLRLATPFAARVASLRRVIDELDFEVDLFTGTVRGGLARDPGYGCSVIPSRVDGMSALQEIHALHAGQVYIGSDQRHVFLSKRQPREQRHPCVGHVRRDNPEIRREPMRNASTVRRSACWSLSTTRSTGGLADSEPPAAM
jgi:transposase